MSKDELSRAKKKILDDQERAKKDEGQNNTLRIRIPPEVRWQLKCGIEEELLSHDFFITNYEPVKFVISHNDLKQIVNAYVGKVTQIVMDVNGKPDYSDGKPVTEEVPKLRYGKPIINAIPLTVTKYDSSVRIESKYGITFLTNTAKQITTQVDTIEGITIELRDKGLLLKIREAEEALAGILNSMEYTDKIKITNETETLGFYLVKEKLIACGVHSKIPTIIEIKQCIEVIEELVLRKYKNKEVLPTIIKWAMAAPFDYAMKSHHNWIEWLHLFGFTTAGKTTMGRIALAIWRVNDGNHDISFQSINTSPRLGQVISQSTFPILINEVGALNDDKFIDIVEMIKNATESKNARSKFTSKNRFSDIPALSACILTGNFPPPFDGAYRRKVLPIYFSENDKHIRQNETEEFTQWLKNKLQVISTLGDFTRVYVFAKPEILKKSWKEMGVEILSKFYADAGFEIPKWIYAFVEQTQVTDTIEENFLTVRGFIVNLINDKYNRYIRNLGDDKGFETDLLTKLDFCCKFQLLPFIHYNNNSAVYCITSDIMLELRNNKLDNMVPSLKGLADILKFQYGTQRISNIPMKVAYIHRADLYKLLEIKTDTENIPNRYNNPGLIR